MSSSTSSGPISLAGVEMLWCEVSAPSTTLSAADSGNPNPVPIWLKRGDDDQDRAVEAPPSLKKVADSKFELRHEYGGDRSPIRGGGSAGDENQQILVEDSGEEDVGEEDGGRRRRHGRHRHRREDGGRRRKRRRHRREDR